MVYDPAQRPVHGHQGRGAFLNERRIRVSKRTQLKECPDLHGLPTFRPGDNFKNYLAMMGDVMQRTAACAARLGRTGPGLCGSGLRRRLFETGLSSWDVAAGSLLRPGRWPDGHFTGEADFMDQKECLAGTPRIYGQMVQIAWRKYKFASAGEKAALRRLPGSAPTPEDQAQDPAPDAAPADDAGEDAPL